MLEKSKMIRYLMVLLICLWVKSAVAAEFIVEETTRAKQNKSWIALPYVFKTESTGLTGGVVGIWNGYFQPQMTVVATVFVGEELTVQKEQYSTEEDKANSEGGVIAFSGYRLPGLNRTFLTFMGSYAYYPNQNTYVDGSNDSSKENGVSSQGYNNWMTLDFRTVLPFGETKDDPVVRYIQTRGITTNRDGYGGGVPFVTGKTVFGLKPFYQKLTADKLVNVDRWNTNGLKYYVAHENTDYQDNPSRGYRFKLQGSNDFGMGESTQTWNAVDASYSHFVEMPKMSWAEHSVMAFNLWTAYSPSWNKSEQNNNKNHRPPPWEGARLGGWDRMRGYDSNRFSDKAAFYMGAEYRVIPRFNPLRDENWIPFPIDWFQVVGFVEAGRVAPSYSLREFTTDVKADVGLSLRALAAKVPVRFDVGVGSEGVNMWVMLNNTF